MGVKKKVLVFGGGVGGLSAAHELTEGSRADHFDVTVVEGDCVFGGKARSEIVAGMPPHPNRYPGEHGFRFFPTFYRHVIDTMQRIPSTFPGRQTVFDHLRGTPLRLIARYGHPPITMPTAPNLLDLGSLLHFIEGLFGANTGLTASDLWVFAGKLVQIATTSRAQKLAEFETQSWWEFVEANRRSKNYQHYLASGLTRALVAAEPSEINAMTGGDVLARILIDSGTGVPASADRVLDGPTSLVWIDQWLSALEHRHVTFRHGTSLLSLDLAADNTIAGARVQKPGGATETLTADYYVAALPVEQMADVLDRSPAVRQAGERLSGLATLRMDVRSMTGAQFYLNQPLKLPPKMGHSLYVDTEWALTSIAQSTFWRAPFDDLSAWGDGTIRTVWSVILSAWNSPYPAGGGTSANRSPLPDLRARTVAQLVASLNGDGVQRFDPASIVAWNLDAGVTPGDASHDAVNTLRLLINTPKSWRHRPSAAPAGLGNLMLAADYVRTNTNLATMEGANEAARRAVNAILEQEGVDDPCAIYELYYPDILADDPIWSELLQSDGVGFHGGAPWRSPSAHPLERDRPISP